MSQWGDKLLGIPDESRCGVITILNTLLAAEYTLYTKTRNYHWNVTGRQFNDLHKFFEEQYEELNECVDAVPERTCSLGGMAFGAAIIRSLRKDLVTCDEQYHDMGTSDFLTGLMEKHEKMAWMLRAFLEGESL
jgi:starvation-inducible DNA-binding protein